MSRLGKAGEEATSGASIRSAGEPVMDDESERMAEASVEITHLTNPEVRGAAFRAGGALAPPQLSDEGLRLRSSVGRDEA